MLQHVTGEHFRPLLDQPCPLHLPDGSQLPIQIESVDERPRSRLSQDHRISFNVQLRSLAPTDFIDGLCSLDLPGAQRLENLFVSREPAMGRDERFGYYCIVFN
ncbi:DUF6916 family protein [Pseudomonas sp. NPDC090202]|uniref:DUF6916 family protein n=1 Tax=unclassified Pseudomonas TaxID=196821 RepID=UPI0037F5F784